MNTAWSKPTKYVVGVGLVLLALCILYLIRSILSLLIIAALIAVLLRPAIMWLQQVARLPRGLAVALVYLVALITVPLAMLLAVPAVVNAVHYVVTLDYQIILKGVTEWLRSTLVSIRATRLPVPALDAYIDPIIDALLAEVTRAAPTTAPSTPPVSTILRSLGAALTVTFDAAAGLIGAVVSYFTLMIFMILSSFYMSLSAHTYRQGFLNAVPAPFRPEIAMLLGRIGAMWNAFFRGQLSLMVLIGVMSWFGLTVLGVPGALSLGIIAGLLEIIPNLGPLLATIPAVIVALLQGSSYLDVSNLFLAGLVIGLYILIQQLENNLIVPRLLGNAVELPPLVVMTGVFVGATTFGILGALLATPVIASGREILIYVYRKMLGQDPFPPREAVPEPEARPTFQQRLLSLLAIAQQRLTRPRTPAPKSDKGAKVYPDRR